MPDRSSRRLDVTGTPSLRELAMGVIAARKRIRPFLPPTPLVEAIALSAEVQADLFLKLETAQPTRSFKVRGAFSKLTSLNDEQRARGVITASSGNHGQAVAYAASRMKCPATIVLPRPVAPTKLEAIRRFDVEILIDGEDCTQAGTIAKAMAAESGRIYIPPYNDAEVLQGQGSIGLELVDQLAKFDNVFVAIGGGGLIAGIGTILKHIRPSVRIFGCSAANSEAISASLRKRRLIEVAHRPTWADGLAGSIEADSITFPICQSVVDRSLLCEEEEIERALLDLLAGERLLVEGAAAVTLAAYRQIQAELKGQTSVLLMCGANIAVDALGRLMVDQDRSCRAA